MIQLKEWALQEQKNESTCLSNVVFRYVKCVQNPVKDNIGVSELSSDGENASGNMCKSKSLKINATLNLNFICLAEPLTIVLEGLDLLWNMDRIGKYSGQMP